MSAGQAIVIALRLLIPLTILRWPLFGGIASMIIDALDVVIVDALHLGGFGDHYSELDKALDSYYLTLELIVALRWESAYARLPALALYAYRGIGVIAFELTHARVLLFIFPNVFENWWLYVVFVAQFFPRLYPRSVKTVVIPLLLLLIPKMAQEYLLHYQEAQPWDWLKHRVLHTS